MIEVGTVPRMNHDSPPPCDKAHNFLSGHRAAASGNTQQEILSSAANDNRIVRRRHLMVRRGRGHGGIKRKRKQFAQNTLGGHFSKTDPGKDILDRRNRQIRKGQNRFQMGGLQKFAQGLVHFSELCFQGFLADLGTLAILFLLEPMTDTGPCARGGHIPQPVLARSLGGRGHDFDDIPG